MTAYMPGLAPTIVTTTEQSLHRLSPEGHGVIPLFSTSKEAVWMPVFVTLTSARRIVTGPSREQVYMTEGAHTRDYVFRVTATGALEPGVYVLHWRAGAVAGERAFIVPDSPLNALSSYTDDDRSGLYTLGWYFADQILIPAGTAADIVLPFILDPVRHRPAFSLLVNNTPILDRNVDIVSTRDNGWRVQVQPASGLDTTLNYIVY